MLFKCGKLSTEGDCMSFKDNFLIEKRNVLNEIRSNSMTLQELRFFSIYLSKINSRDVSTRVVRFLLSDFQKIMEFGKLNMAQLQDTIDGLLSRIVGIPLDNGGFERFQLFKKGVFTQNEYGEWYIEIDAHDDALPLMFEFKEKYFTYQLWNALRLKSSNQLRMYEILKQYESLGERIITVNELKSLLGIDRSEYPRFNSFKERVLDACQKALAENTDITYTYEPYGKLGRGGKVFRIRFVISKNTEYRDRLSLDEFINLQSVSDIIMTDDSIRESDEKPDEKEGSYFTREIYPFLTLACGGEFSQEEIQVLYNLIIRIMPYKPGGSVEGYRIKAYDYLKRKYDELKLRASRKDIEPLKSRFGYMKKVMELELAGD